MAEPAERGATEIVERGEAYPIPEVSPEVIEARIEHLLVQLQFRFSQLRRVKAEKRKAA
jgi:hypothetical protein